MFGLKRFSELLARLAAGMAELRHIRGRDERDRQQEKVAGQAGQNDHAELKMSFFHAPA